MTLAATQVSSASSSAFDGIAECYDEIFTNTLIGRAQRRVVWNALARAFSPTGRILELNCGTGEDAFFLARRGASVIACDASPGMIAVAQRRKALDAPNADVHFQILSNENLRQLDASNRFDGAFSNFSGLNCVSDIPHVAHSLAYLIRPNGRLLLCVSSRFCLWETLWFISRAKAGKAFRRFSGQTTAQVNGSEVRVWYPTIRHLRKMFAPWFTLRFIRAVGLFVPPSYVEPSLTAHAGLISLLAKVDDLCARLPVLRCIGDHVLLEFERIQP